MAEKRASTRVSMGDKPTKKAAAKKKAVQPEEVVEEVVEEVEEPELVRLSVDEEVDEELEDLDPEDLIRRVEDMDPDQELFEGGPTAGDVVNWKKKYGNGIYLTAIDYDEYVIWRTLTRGEYRDHVRNMSELSNSGRMSEIEATLFNEEAICEMCVLYPRMSASSMGNEMAGVPALITQQVMEASGFVALEVRQL